MSSRLKKVAVTGASGFVGRALCAHLEARGVRVLRLVRRPEDSEDEVSWFPDQGLVETAPLEGLDAMVHLAGSPVAAKRWTSAVKDEILRSRTDTTELLAHALHHLKQPPAVFLSASGVGIYGDRGAQELTEQSAPGESFLSDVCQCWEAEARKVPDGTRSVQLRVGFVLGAEGGALSRLLPIFRAGLGGRLGNGEQYLSWIALQDLVRAIVHCLEVEELSGAVNGVGPAPVTNADFTQSLAQALGRPAIVPVPGFALRVAFGEFAGELLSSQRALPKQLEQTGFEFESKDLKSALAAALSAV